MPTSDYGQFYYELWYLLVILDNSTMNTDANNWSQPTVL